MTLRPVFSRHASAPDPHVKPNRARSRRPGSPTIERHDRRASDSAYVRKATRMVGVRVHCVGRGLGDARRAETRPTYQRYRVGGMLVDELG